MDSDYVTLSLGIMDGVQIAPSLLFYGVGI